METQFKSSDLLYDKTCKCPVCETEFKTKAIRSGKTRLVSQDTDLMPIYEGINALLYDVVICPSCGYGSLVKFFEKLKPSQCQLILNNITPRYRPKYYPEVLDIDSSIERHKISLLSTMTKKARISEEAYTCLKIAWLYRLKGDKLNELKFLEQSFLKFKDAYSKETPPFAGMDGNTVCYLIGELARRLDKTEEALQWFSRVILGQGVSSKLKELARDQKDLIKSTK